MITGIDSKTPPPHKLEGEKLVEFLEQQPDVHIEVLEPGFDSVTSIKDIAPLTAVVETQDSNTKQVLLQIISTAYGEEVFGIVAVRNGDVDALILNRMGNGKEYATPVGYITDASPLVVGRAHKNTQGRPLADTVSSNHFQVSIDGLGNIDIRDLNSTNGTEVMTLLRDNNEKSRALINKKSIKRYSNIVKRSEFAPPLANPLEDDNYWAANAADLEHLLGK